MMLIQIFVNAMTEQLSYHVQKYEAMSWLEFELDQKWNFHHIWIVMKNF